MIDSEGFRENVGIILSNPEGQLFWARRIRQDAWQFPQGGIKRGETIEQALYRELHEEIGLDPGQVKVVGSTADWLHYHLPEHLIRYHSKPVCIGQKQIWYLLRLTARDRDVNLNRGARPEFDSWRWVSYWFPIDEVVEFKRGVYRRALEELAPLLFPEGLSDTLS